MNTDPTKIYEVSSWIRYIPKSIDSVSCDENFVVVVDILLVESDTSII